MMKHEILLLILALTGSVLYAQKNDNTNILEGKHAGDTLIGELCKYKLYHDNSGGYLYLVMQNLANRDSDNLKKGFLKRMIHDFVVPYPVIRQFSEIVREFLTPGEREIYKLSNASALIVLCRMKRGKIKELSFHFIRARLKDIAVDAKITPLRAWSYFKKDNMLKQIPVDRYHEIEQALIERIDLGGEKWTKRGKYLRVLIKPYYM